MNRANVLGLRPRPSRAVALRAARAPIFLFAVSLLFACEDQEKKKAELVAKTGGSATASAIPSALAKQAASAPAPAPTVFGKPGSTGTRPK